MEENRGEEGEHWTHQFVCYPEILHYFEARVNAVLCLKCLCERQHLFFFSPFQLFMKVCFVCFGLVWFPNQDLSVTSTFDIV